MRWTTRGSTPDLVLGQFNLRLEGPQGPFVCMGETGMWLALGLSRSRATSGGQLGPSVDPVL